MKREVQLSITGLQTGAEQSDVQQVTSGAEYFQRDGIQYLLYEESQEGTEELQKCRIRLSPGKMELTRRGQMSVRMIFEKNKKHMAEYQTPFGALELGIETREMELLEEEGYMKIQVDYALEMNGTHLSDCRIEIQVTEKSE